MFKFIEKMVGNYSEKEIKRINWMVDEIEALEPIISQLSDAELRAKTQEFRQKLQEGKTLDDILTEAFAVVREAAKRTVGMRHFRVQLIGGIVLHQGRIAEMKTGEGKTLVATLPVYLNALAGQGVHIVTVNDYLAKRDSEWMGKIYNFLGMSVGLIVHGLTTQQRKTAYACDITYGTNNEFGFDYLRDNMVVEKQDMVQRDLNYAIVDEVDSILIDEARTPLIISGPGTKSTDMYRRVNSFIAGFKKSVRVKTDDKVIDEEAEQNLDYIVDEKAHSATLTTLGLKKVEQYFGIDNLSDPDNIELSHHINQALKAHGLMKRDRDYVVKDGEVIIVDEFTGRLMLGRRYSDGLHQAIEAKEGVRVERESKTLATITFQNYFRLYKKLAGMTGTAQTEEQEFRTIYGLDVVVIPTNMPMVRTDYHDVVYRSEKGKFAAVVKEIEECHKKGQPVLVGTISIEKSELLSGFLKKKGIPHYVLNAKQHEKEAEIIAQAGKPYAVTIATNMAGRGTDIMLGGNPEYIAKQEIKKQSYEEHIMARISGFDDTDDVQLLEAREKFAELIEANKAGTAEDHSKIVESGGLHIIGTERHESRRIDNQLRGRAGRQGDPGSSRFYVSLEDDLMRLFGSDRIVGIVTALGMSEDLPIEHNMLSKTIENAQKRVEGNNFDIRKHVLQYDDVMNKQREVIYAQRRKVLDGENIKEYIFKMIESLVDDTVNAYCGEGDTADNWDLQGFTEYVENVLLHKGCLNITGETLENLDRQKLKDDVYRLAINEYEKKELEFGSDMMRQIERMVLLRVVDQKWMDHIDDMDQLRQGIGLRAYGQRDPVLEYQNEGYQMFEEMNRAIKEDTVRALLHIEQKQIAPEKKQPQNMHTNYDSQDNATPISVGKKVGRNEPCPCGSGKKYKKCCGADA